MTQTRQLSTVDGIELSLDLVSFAGGENTIGQDQELKSNEARVIENWDSDSFGGMIRTKGFSEYANGGVFYIAAPDLLLHHFEGATVRNLLIIAGDLAYINGSIITQLTASAFTSGVLSHGVSAGDSAWITNTTDNLKRYTIAGGVVTPSSQPPAACARVSVHKSRLFAEGGSATVYGSRGGSGNWTSGTAWSASGDAWSSTLPELTQGHIVGFPSGNEITVFTKFGTFALSGFPNVGFRPIAPSPGCGAPYSVSLGTEGVYFLSTYPTLGIFLWNGSTFINLTLKEDWISKVNLSGRIHGIYRENKYWFYYNETGSGVTYQNKSRYYDARWGKWSSRPVNASVDDNFGYPAVATKSNNELLVASSRQDIVYSVDDSSNSDNSYPTNANYKTKDFTSKDFGIDLDELTLKLIKVVVTYYGSVGEFSINWTADRGRRSGSMVFSMTADGNLLNTSFVMNTSLLSVLPPDRTSVRKFGNSAVGKRFDFQILNAGTGDRLKIKKILIKANIVGDTQDITFQTPSSGVTSSSDSMLHPDTELVVDTSGGVIKVS